MAPDHFAAGVTCKSIYTHVCMYVDPLCVTWIMCYVGQYQCYWSTC